ncbi:hypothetical protein [Saccharicrinis sp. FJH54]|uniref:hypothetical protein n=1 Tax=Saccharicrinis sp. FJH54 TaxID=3344665 RepID=UPI0035D4A088
MKPTFIPLIAVLIILTVVLALNDNLNNEQQIQAADRYQTSAVNKKNKVVKNMLYSPSHSKYVVTWEEGFEKSFTYTNVMLFYEIKELNKSGSQYSINQILDGKQVILLKGTDLNITYKWLNDHELDLTFKNNSDFMLRYDMLEFKGDTVWITYHNN